jgi:hypothetical protein
MSIVSSLCSQLCAWLVLSPGLSGVMAEHLSFLCSVCACYSAGSFTSCPWVSAHEHVSVLLFPCSALQALLLSPADLRCLLS